MPSMSDQRSPSICRAPHGARGLKYHEEGHVIALALSRPARGAWIEIEHRAKLDVSHLSRPARGAWIEISIVSSSVWYLHRRAPHGARGLK